MAVVTQRVRRYPFSLKGETRFSGGSCMPSDQPLKRVRTHGISRGRRKDRRCRIGGLFRKPLGQVCCHV